MINVGIYIFVLSILVKMFSLSHLFIKNQAVFCIVLPGKSNLGGLRKIFFQCPSYYNINLMIEKGISINLMLDHPEIIVEKLYFCSTTFLQTGPEEYSCRPPSLVPGLSPTVSKLSVISQHNSVLLLYGHSTYIVW